MRILTVVGARPQFVKCAAVSRLLRARHEEILVHTGQHFDPNMSERFFVELGIPEPDVNLGIAGGLHGEMTGRMLAALEKEMMRARPDWVLVYGDTNSTMAAALAAVKLSLPVAHVEAGLRSFNRKMPEEINRVVTDHVSTLLLCPTARAVRWLADEGIVRGVFDVGDVMFDSALAGWARAKAELPMEELLKRLGVPLSVSGQLGLVTVHRAENTDDPDRLKGILSGLARLPLALVFPVHPRTRAVLERSPAVRSLLGPNVFLVDPLGYLELLRIAGESRLVLTDSGGLQKEAFFLGVPCVTLRDETEWPETIEAGGNVLTGADGDRIAEEGQRAAGRLQSAPLASGGPFGDGHAAEKIVALLESVRPGEGGRTSGLVLDREGGQRSPAP